MTYASTFGRRAGANLARAQRGQAEPGAGTITLEDLAAPLFYSTIDGRAIRCDMVDRVLYPRPEDATYPYAYRPAWNGRRFVSITQASLDLGEAWPADKPPFTCLYCRRGGFHVAPRDQVFPVGGDTTCPGEGNPDRGVHEWVCAAELAAWEDAR